MTRHGMQIRPVMTEQEYRAAVARIADSTDAVEGSPAGDELEVLATLVDAYESKHFVMDVPTPPRQSSFAWISST